MGEMPTPRGDASEAWLFRPRSTLLEVMPWPPEFRVYIRNDRVEWTAWREQYVDAMFPFTRLLVGTPKGAQLPAVARSKGGESRA